MQWKASKLDKGSISLGLLGIGGKGAVKKDERLEAVERSGMMTLSI